MSIKTKIWIRSIVIAGILAWPGVESFRLWDTAQKLAGAQALERSVKVKLEAARARHVQVASTPASAGTTETKP
jgi:hypothetical protein